MISKFHHQSSQLGNSTSSFCSPEAIYLHAVQWGRYSIEKYLSWYRYRHNCMLIFIASYSIGFEAAQNWIREGSLSYTYETWHLIYVYMFNCRKLCPLLFVIRHNSLAGKFVLRNFQGNKATGFLWTVLLKEFLVKNIIFSFPA